MKAVQIKAERTVDLAAAHIRDAILTGDLEVGTFLPAERGLAATLGINRLTLRAALARLESEGLVRPEHGKGVLVLDYRQNAGLDLVRHLEAAEHPKLLADFLELRRIIAAEAIALLCDRQTPDALARLQHLADLQQTESDLTAFAERDLLFARELVRSTGNSAFELLVNSVEQICASDPQLVAAMYADRDAVQRSYPAVVALIKAGDANSARDMVHRALSFIDDQTLTRLRQP